MERNDSGNFSQNSGGSQSDFGGQSGSSFGGTTGGFSESGSSSNTESFSAADSSRSSGDQSSSSSPESGVSGVASKVKSVASSVKGKASNIPGMLADGLQAGADALRQRRTQIAGVDGSGSATADGSSLVAVTDSLAEGMQSSAEWLRDADLDKLKDGLETQVKEHPARTLLIALGAGYIIGKAFRR